MVDENDTNINDALENAINSTQEASQALPDGSNLGGWSESVLAATEKTNQFNTAIQNLSGFSSGLSQSLGQAAQAVNQFGKALQDQEQTTNKLDFTSKVSSGVSEIKQSIIGMVKSGSDELKKLSDVGENLNSLFGSGSVIAITHAQKRLAELTNSLLGNLVDAHAEVLKFNMASSQIGMAFGQGFNDAEASSGAFRDKIVETKQTLFSTNEEIEKIRGGFKDVLNVSDQVGTITNLSKATAALGANLTAYNAAMAVSAATGADSAQITDIIGKSYTELGEDLSGAVLNLGAIGAAAEKSGLGFGKVAKSILESTSTLKMWGGTVGAVAPLYKAFADSLTSQGVGKQGLTPELLQSFIGGLDKMGFSTRALLGMRAPGMGGRGALGSGLQMEAALEKGDYGQIVEGISSTLKEFGGGQLLTLQEAAENPALERNFLLQRQLLMQSLKLDESSAIQMMGILKDIDKGGVKAIADQEDQLAKLVGGGRSMLETTRGGAPKERANIQFQTAVMKSLPEITKGLQEMVEKIGAQQGITAVQETLKDAIGRGSINIQEDVKNLKGRMQSGKSAEEQGLLDNQGRVRETPIERQQSMRRRVGQAARRQQAQANRRQNLQTGGLAAHFQKAQDSGQGIAASLEAARVSSQQIRQAFEGLGTATIGAKKADGQSALGIPQQPRVEPPTLEMPQQPRVPTSIDTKQQIAHELSGGTPNVEIKTQPATGVAGSQMGVARDLSAKQQIANELSGRTTEPAKPTTTVGDMDDIQRSAPAQNLNSVDLIQELKSDRAAGRILKKEAGSEKPTPIINRGFDFSQAKSTVEASELKMDRAIQGESSVATKTEKQPLAGEIDRDKQSGVAKDTAITIRQEDIKIGKSSPNYAAPAVTQPISTGSLQERRRFKNQFESYAAERKKIGAAAGGAGMQEQREFNVAGIRSEIRRDRLSRRDAGYISRRTEKFGERARGLMGAEAESGGDLASRIMARMNTAQPEKNARQQAVATMSPKKELGVAPPPTPREEPQAGGGSGARGGRGISRVSKDVEVDIDLKVNTKGTTIDIEPVVRKINRNIHVEGG